MGGREEGVLRGMLGAGPASGGDGEVPEDVGRGEGVIDPGLGGGVSGGTEPEGIKVAEGTSPLFGWLGGFGEGRDEAGGI